MKTIDKIIKSIFAINSTAQFTFIKEDIDNIEWLGETTPISKSDIQAKMSTIEAEIAQVETNKQTKKASGKQKLLDLGLTEEEVKALIGV